VSGDEDGAKAFASQVPIQRSAIAFARGVCVGVWVVSIPTVRKTASVNVVSRSRMR
jgi:hypothetical protein